MSLSILPEGIADLFGREAAPAAVTGLRRRPAHGRGRGTARVDIEQEFRAAPDDLGEGQFTRGGELFGPAIEIVRELDLGFDHECEEILSLHSDVNFSSYAMSRDLVAAVP